MFYNFKIKTFLYKSNPFFSKFVLKYSEISAVAKAPKPSAPLRPFMVRISAGFSQGAARPAMFAMFSKNLFETMPPFFPRKTVLITGAASGLGRALAVECHKQGAHLALLDIDFEGLQQLKSALQNDSQRISIHRADVSEEVEIADTRKAVLEEHGGLDVLINNAGISISLPFEQMELADYRRLFEINFWGTVYCTKHFLPDLKQKPKSHLVNITSDFALLGFPGKTAYGSSKSAIMGFTNALHTELAGSSVRASLVIPPPLDTGLVIRGKHIDGQKQRLEAEFLRKHGMPLDKAAKRIVRQLKRGKYRIVIGSLMFWIDRLSRVFPTAVHRAIGRVKINFVS